MLDETRPEFAWLRTPDRDWALRITGASAEPDPATLNFFAPDFALNHATPWLTGPRIAVPATDVPLPQPKIQAWVEPSAAEFDQLHESILNRLQFGEFEKVVPVVQDELDFAAPLSPRMFPRAFAPGENQFSYGFQYQGEGLCGITPELLFKVEDHQLTTMALAGTGRVDGPSLLDDAKERREHQLVINHLTQELETWGPPEVGVTVERAYGQLKHLYTPICLALKKDVSFMQLVLKLHPTAALGGWPRRPAVEWLAAQNFHVTRGRFGAPFGVMDQLSWQCVVAIRCLLWKDQRARVPAGCGIVRGSQAAREWAELALKRSSVYRNLGLDRDDAN